MRDGEPELGLMLPHELLHEGGLAGAGGAAEDHHQIVVGGGGGRGHVDVSFPAGGHIVTGMRELRGKRGYLIAFPILHSVTGKGHPSSFWHWGSHINTNSLTFLFSLKLYNCADKKNTFVFLKKCIVSTFSKRENVRKKYMIFEKNTRCMSFLCH